MVFTRLKNVGNTCFLNATLQCLVHLVELNEWLDKNEPEKVLIKEYNDLRKLMQLRFKDNFIIQSFRKVLLMFTF